MTFTSDFEAILDQYDIRVSDRTRRLIRRNYEKSLIEKQYFQPKRSALVDLMYIVWQYIKFIISTIFKITLIIMSGIVYVCLFLINLAIEVYCVCLIATIMKTVIQQYQLN
jgi:hypothetical protein